MAPRSLQKLGGNSPLCPYQHTSFGRMDHEPRVLGQAARASTSYCLRVAKGCRRRFFKRRAKKNFPSADLESK